MTSSYGGQLSLHQGMPRASAGPALSASTKKQQSNAVRKNDLSKMRGSGVDAMMLLTAGKRQRVNLKLACDDSVILFSGKKKTDAQRILLSRIWSITTGQNTKGFKETGKISKKAKKGANDAKNLDNDDFSDSDSIYEVHYQEEEEKLSLSIFYIGSEDYQQSSTMDLVFLSKADFDSAHRSIAELVQKSHTEAKADVLDLDLPYLRMALADSGKDIPVVQGAGSKLNRIKFEDFRNLLDGRLNVSYLSDKQLKSLFKEHAKSIRVKPDEGLTLPQCLELLRLVRLRIQESEGMAPVDALWHQMEKEKSTEGVGYVTADEFLKFLHRIQSERKITVDEVKEKIRVLNSKSSQQTTGKTANSKVEDSKLPKVEDSKLSKEAFSAFMLSDANDAFDTVKGWMGRSDMTQPLSRYWINTCSDALYQQDNGNGMEGLIFALNRGCRCIDIRVWDGTGSMKGEPVIARSKREAATERGQVSLVDMLKATKAFLRSNTDVFPIILSIENHCTMGIQNRMARYLIEILGGNLYKPRTRSGLLPSPESMKGMVVVKGKYPIDKEGVTLFDDYDADLENVPDDSSAICSFDMNNDLEMNESFISDKPHAKVDKSPVELWDEAKTNSRQAQEGARKADQHAFKLAVEANKAEELASKLLTKFGWTFDHAPDTIAAEREEAKQRAEDESLNSDLLSDVESMGTTEKYVDESPSQEFSTVSDGSSFDFPSLSQAASDLVSGFKILGWNNKRNGDGGTTETARSDGESIRSESTSGTRRTKDTGSAISGANAREKMSLAASKKDKEKESEQEREKEKEKAKTDSTEALAKSVENMRKKVAVAEAATSKASETSAIALSNLQQASTEVSEAQQAFEAAKQAEVKAIEESEIAASQARAKREHSDTAAKRILTVREMLKKCKEQESTAEGVKRTALAEYKISQQRFSEASARAAKAKSNAQQAVTRADKETKDEEVLDSEIGTLKKTLTEAAKKRERAEKLKAQATISLVKITEAIEIFANEESPSVPDAVKESKNEAVADLHAATDAAAEAEQRVVQTQRALRKVKAVARKQAEKAAAARNHADQFTAIAEQLAEHAEEEEDAATLRRVATEKAEVNVKRVEAEIKGLEAQLVEAERAAKESSEMVTESVQHAEKLAADVVEIKKRKHKTISLLRDKVEEKDSAQRAFDAAQVVKGNKEKKLGEFRKLLGEASELYDRAERKVTEKKHRTEAENHAQRSALAARDRAISVRKKADEARLDASYAMARAAEATTVERYAYDYKTKMDKMLPLSLKLTKVTLLNGVKLKYLEKSKTLPYTHMHNIGEEELRKKADKGLDTWASWIEFNVNHMTRTFPSTKEISESKNYNPVLPWALGCQLVSTNFGNGAEELWVNDGRFRENGSSGYVLKPNLTSEMGEYVSHLKVRVLSGQRLPRPASEPQGKKLKRKPVNPRVTVSVYDVVPGTKKVSAQHMTTPTVQGNSLCPVWNQTGKECAHFKVASPTTAVVLFTVWDSPTFRQIASSGALERSMEEGDQFIAAAAIPYSCLREGFRSVQLFDWYHTRCGMYSFSSLFVHIKISAV